MFSFQIVGSIISLIDSKTWTSKAYKMSNFMEYYL
nr:MAG TPA: hypothetical protein [Caudoviricetes sp.]